MALKPRGVPLRVHVPEQLKNATNARLALKGSTLAKWVTERMVEFVAETELIDPVGTQVPAPAKKRPVAAR
jgi:hypothetical protein